MSQVVERLAKLGIVLPRAAAPVANYVGAQKSGALLFVSGQLPFGSTASCRRNTSASSGLAPSSRRPPRRRGRRRSTCSRRRRPRSAISTASCRVVRLGGFFAVDGRFDSLPQAMNGASDLFAAAFGERGRHARTTVGVAFLPLFSIVEVEAI